MEREHGMLHIAAVVRGAQKLIVIISVNICAMFIISL